MMQIGEAIEYITSNTWSQWRLGLERTYELLERVGHPDKQLKFVHVAGTNGKGSTCAMIESMLRAAGYTTGTYPSPYIEDFRERIQVNGELIPKEALTGITERVASAADMMEDHPSQFELITAIGMLYFMEQKCDFVVLEVGMGGALDSTNVIEAPEVAVIANIGLDHTEYLGDTIEKITETKCGIIKSGSSVVSYSNVSSVMEIIRNTCKEKRAPLYEAKDVKFLCHDLYGQKFLSEGREYVLSLLGKNQVRNAATVLSVVDALRDKGYVISDETVSKGLSQVKWPARFEVLSHEPLFILDGGHNPQCAQALAENLEAYLPADKIDKQNVTFLIGMLKDKDYHRVLDTLKPYGFNYVCITPENTRALNGDELADTIRSMNPDHPGKIVSADSIKEGIQIASAYGLPVVAFGSLYSAGEIRRVYLSEFCRRN